MNIDLPVSDALQEPTRPVSLGFQILLGLASGGATMSLLPVLIVLIPAQVMQIDPVNATSSLAFVLTMGAIAALVGNPLAGAFSDRTTSRFGRRRPWLLIGALGIGIGLTMLARSTSIAMLAAAWFTVQFFGNVLLSCYNAILPDRVPVRQRGTTQAIVGLASPFAIVLSDVLFARAHDFSAAYLPIIAAEAVLAVMFILFYRETPLPKDCLPPFQLKQFLGSFWVSPRKYPVFFKSWIMWLLFWMGYNLANGGYFFLFVQNIVRYEAVYPGHLMKEGMATIQMLQIFIGVPLMLAVGVLSDRAGNRRTFVLGGTALMAAGLVSLIAFSGWVEVVIISVTIGAGFWIFYSLGLAMISQILPSASDRGRHLGVINIASCVPQVVNPWIGAAVVGGFGAASPVGYQILFGIGVLAVLAGMGILRTINERN